MTDQTPRPWIRCPDCGAHGDDFKIAATIWVRVVINDDAGQETEAETADHDYDPDSLCGCLTCGATHVLRQFELCAATNHKAA